MTTTASTDYLRHPGSFSTISGHTLTCETHPHGHGPNAYRVRLGSTWTEVRRVADGWEAYSPDPKVCHVLYAVELERLLGMIQRAATRLQRLVAAYPDRYSYRYWAV